MFIDFLQVFLPIVVYILLIIILIVGIIVGIKTLHTLDKVERIVDNVSDKVNSLNGVFGIIDVTTDKLVGLTDKIVEGISNLINKLLFKKKKIESEED